MTDKVEYEQLNGMKTRSITVNLEQAHAEIVASHQSPNQTDTRLRGGWLILARTTWVVVFILALGVFIIRIPYRVADLHIICTTAACSNSSRLTLDSLHELRHLGLSIDFWAIFNIAVSVVLEIGYVLTGIMIFWRRTDDRMALITSLALLTFGNAFNNANPVTPLPAVLYVLTLSLAFFGNSCIGLCFYLFPTGQFVPHWTRWLALCWIVYWGFDNLFLGSFLSNTGLSFVLFSGLLISMVAFQVYRYRRVSTAVQRQQTKWVVFGLSIALVGTFVSIGLFNFPLDIIAIMVVGVLLYVFLLLIPLSISFAILRYRLWDIDIIINHTLVYGALTGSIVGIYVLVVGYLGVLFRTGSNLLISLIAAGLVAVLFQPLRERLQRGANRLLYGQRDEPYRVLSRLGHRLEATLAPDAVLPTIAESVAQALKLPYAAIMLRQQGNFVIAASYGQVPKEGLTRLPLVYQTEQLGELVLAPRAIGETFSAADRSLLGELARQAGVAAHAVRLTTDLQRLTGELQSSRTQLVTTREEERRRLRRDLHDGLGSALTSVTFQLDAASNLLDRDPQAVKVLLQDLKVQTQASIADIRRLVYNLRPPILDEWGLVAALREQVAQYQLNNVQVTVDAPELSSALPAAIEVAAYRIALEALANVIRHANASTCTICLSISDDALAVDVRDDGRGLPENYHAGVGVNAMHERAAELGGSCVVEKSAVGGTRVYARLPLLKE